MAATEEELNTDEKEMPESKLDIVEPNEQKEVDSEFENPPSNEQHKEVEESKEVFVNQGETNESILETAKAGDVFLSTSTAIPQPLNLSWSYGYNSTLPVHNISYSDKKMVFYVSNQTGVLYDCDNHKQHLLQGHGNPISCVAASTDRRWLVTADIGYSPLLIIWDSYTAIPVRTFFDKLGQGLIAVAVSPDSKYIATLSITMPQIMSIWDWTDERDVPVHSTTLPLEHGLQTCITFSQKDSNLLLSNSEETVIFFQWDNKGLKFHSTPLTDKDFNKPIGYISQAVFVPDNKDCAVSATSLGYGIVWETTGLHQDNVDVSSLCVYRKTPIKLMMLHDVPITTITSYKQYIVTGDMQGQIKFHDVNLTLINWYDHLKCGPIVSISFAFDLTIAKQTNLSQYPLQSTLDADPFVVPNFVVSSSNAIICHITLNGTIQDTILRESDSGVPCIATHPNDSIIIIASNNGIVKLWDYDKKVVIVTRSFSGKFSLTSIQFDPSGEFIGIGFSDGEVRILCSLTLEDRSHPFNYSTEPITVIAFSTGPRIYMATAGLDLTTSLFVMSSEEKGTESSWRFLARHKAHYKKILSLVFGTSPETGLPRLLSLSEDRHIVEYDLTNTSKDDLKLLSVDKIEQSAVPTAITWYPAVSKESFLITANNQLKLKLYNSSTKMCRRTLLGPTYGSSIKKIAILPKQSVTTIDNKRHLAYITKDKIGLLILPHDGNPHNTMCLTAHSGQVTDLAVSYDGQYIFSAGGEDCTVNMWAVDTIALDVASKLGGPALEPFYSLIEGGREGSFFAELEQFFYYAQIKSQGPDTVNGRNTSLTIPLVQIPFVMRAIGFYPSEHEIEDMLNEVKFSRYAESGEYVTQIDLEDFIKLYINHRPVHGLTPNMFSEAFKNLGHIDFESKQWKIDRSHLLTVLQERGEHLTEVDLVEHLMSLLGCCENPEVDGVYVEKPDDVLLNDIPPLISAQEFIEDIVGLSS